MRALLFFLLVLALVGCDSSNDTQDASASATTGVAESTAVTAAPSTTTVATTATTVAATTTAPTTTTISAPTTTTTAPTTTTTRAAPTTTTGDPYVVGVPTAYPLGPLPGSDGASGSGCAPGTGPLPDGVWLGYVDVIGTASVEFDLACFYFGDIAYTKGAEDGVEVDNDWYERNTNPAFRTVPVATDATVYELDATYDGFLTVPFADWPADSTHHSFCPSDSCMVWLFVNGGEATEILEQFTP